MSSSSSSSWRIAVAEIERQQRIDQCTLVDVPLDDGICATASNSSDDAVYDADAVAETDKTKKINNSDECPWPSWPFELVAVLGVLILGAVAITLIVLNSKANHAKLAPVNRGNSNSNANNNSVSQGSSVSNNYRPSDFTRAKFSKQIQAILNVSDDQLANKNSVQYKAFEWIVTVDSLPYNYTDFQLVQRFALIALYYSTGHWSPFQGGWGMISGSRVQECEWVGVDCDEKNVVRGLALQNIAPTKLRGSIPNEIHWLQPLQSLLLNDNELSGELPSGLYELRNLENLDLSTNNLTSTLSPMIGNLKLLAGLDVRNNSMVGSLPSELGLVTNLRQILLSGNENISGTIPSELGHMSRLADFEFQRTALIGSMPRQVCSLQTLGQLVTIRADCGVTCPCCGRCG